MDTKIGTKVAKVIDEKSLVINRGSNDGIKKGDKFIIYHIGEEITDPDTGESLGSLEIISGTGIVTNVQDRISTIVSCEKEMVSGTRTIRKNGISSLLGDVEEIKDPTYSIKEFNKPKVGYLAKKIN